jgi:sugar phosphate isomerase/epimerase
MSSKIALQLYSIKELTEKNFLGALKNVAEIGYNGVEFAGFFNTQEDLLFIELDTFWAEYCGLRSVDFIHKYGERCSLLHIKDMKSLEEKVNTEIGKGVMDFKEIVAAGKQYGVEWYTVEQEEFEIPQLQSIRESYEYLKGIV